MTDIFLSYAKNDSEVAEQFATALANKGWNVWWDRNIPAGRIFEEVIEEAINEAKCVVVLWSESSMNSRWVKTEASEGAERQILVPVTLDGSRIPLAFRQIQTADMQEWDGELDSPQIEELNNSIRHTIDRAAGPEKKDNVVSFESRTLQIQTIEINDDVMHDIDAMVIEQDTGLVLAFSDEIRYPRESLKSLTKQILSRGEPEQGTVLELKTVPPQLIAIVHDLNSEPSWTEDSVLTALKYLLKISARRKFRSIAMPLLGTVHGKLPTTRARELLDVALAEVRVPSLQRIWIIST